MKTWHYSGAYRHDLHGWPNTRWGTDASNRWWPTTIEGCLRQFRACCELAAYDLKRQLWLLHPDVFTEPERDSAFYQATRDLYDL